MAGSAAAAAVIAPTGVLATHGDTGRVFALASVTKPLVARAVQVAVEEGVVELDTPAGPPGSTVRHLLAHASGLAMALRPGAGQARYPSDVFEHRLHRAGRDGAAGVGDRVRALPGRGGVRAARDGATRLDGGASSAGFGATSTVADLAAFAGDLLRPSTVSTQMHAEATSVQFPGLDGVLPGYGVQRPNDWGLGFELRDAKSPHWTGAQNSARTYGHFGQAGGFIWADPEADLALVVLTDRDFGDWALDTLAGAFRCGLIAIHLIGTEY